MINSIFPVNPFNSLIDIKFVTILNSNNLISKRLTVVTWSFSKYGLKLEHTGTGNFGTVLPTEDIFPPREQKGIKEEEVDTF